jgi:hypothetical protein
MIRRLLDWVACLVRRRLACLLGRNGPTPGPKGPETPPTPEGALKTQETASDSSGWSEASTPNETMTTEGQGGAEGPHDTRSETAIEPELENESRNGEGSESVDEPEPTTDGSLPPGPDNHRVGSKPERPPHAGHDATQPQPKPSEPRVIPPENRGGGPRSPRCTEDRRGKQGPEPGTRRPEIVCWKQGREWVVGVEIPDGVSGSGNIAVVQGDAQLSKDDSRAGCCRLATLNTPVKVQVIGSSDNWTIDIPLEDEAWLLFKLSGRGRDRGRKVKRASSGSYLAIVPKTWHRDEARAGNAPTTPEPVFLQGYLAHFFELTEDVPCCIAFRDDVGNTRVMESGGPLFHLAGQEIQDASEGIGRLFGGLPPRICIAKGKWSDVGTIVVGQEGGGLQRWRKSFKPKADQPEQELPHEVLERRAGWYFLRLYDRTDTLIDSLDFRFVAGLREILIPTAGPLPSSDGHVAQTVEILHDADYRVTQAGHECPGLKAERRADKTILTIPPRADCDRTRWFIQAPNSHERKVELTILIARVWWALWEHRSLPPRWEDKPAELTPEDLNAASGRVIWLRFPRPRVVSYISAGFCRERSRKFQVRVGDSTVAIPLHDFSGAQELDDRAHSHSFKVWLETGSDTHEVTIGILPIREGDGGLDLASLPAHRLATVLTKLRRAARGPARRLIKKVRSKYRRAPHSRPERNEEFVKEGLCLIAILLERAGNNLLFIRRLPNYWKRNAKLACGKFSEIAQELEKALSGVNR